MRPGWSALALLALASDPAGAEEVLRLRIGEHPGRTRLVLDWPGRPDYRAEQQGERLLIRLPPGYTLPPDTAQRRARLAQALEAAPEGLVLTLRPGVRVRHMVLDRRVVLDLNMGEAPVASKLPAPATVQPALAAPATTKAPVSSPPASPVPAEPAAAAAPSPRVAAEPIAAPALAPPRAVSVHLLSTAGQAPVLHFPLADSAAAIVRRGEALLIAFATPQPLDLGPLRGHPLLAAAELVALPGGSLLRLPLTAPGAVLAERRASGWVLRLNYDETMPQAAALTPTVFGDDRPRLALAARQPGPVLAMTDPETGLPLLLGTVREAGQGVLLPRRLAEFDLLATQLGLAVLARSDSITLTTQPERFLVDAAAGARLALNEAAASSGAAAHGMSRSFDLPEGPEAALFNRLRSQQAGIAATAPLARGPARRAAGATLIALGLAQEAQSMLSLAMAEDPAVAADPATVALAAAAALLAGRPEEARPLRTLVLPETDEITLWRAALAAVEGEAARAAQGFAVSLPLLLDYPPPLRDRLLPLAAEALAEVGDKTGLARVLDAVPAAALPLSRAMLLEASGRTVEAVTAYEAVARGTDRRARAIAIRRGLDLKLAAGSLDAGTAAKVLDSALYAWRGDGVELAARRRLAALRMQAREASAALAVLEETAQLFPDQAEALRPMMLEALMAALRDAPPVAAIALHDSRAELLRDSGRADEAGLLLAERLVALDLPERAAAMLARAADSAVEPAGRAALGLKLAALRLEEGDATAALTALETTRAESLPASLSRERVVLAARAEARRGQLAKAVAGLEALGGSGAGPLADLLAEAQDWPGAAAAGARALAAFPTAPVPLDAAQQRAVLRQAALLVLAGDEQGVAALRAAHGGRLDGGPLAPAFAALTAERLQGLRDLPRLAREQQLFRNLPGRLEALRAGAPVTR